MKDKLQFTSTARACQKQIGVFKHLARRRTGNGGQPLVKLQMLQEQQHFREKKKSSMQYASANRCCTFAGYARSP